MKPFDLEAAKAGAPLVTRDGRPARFLAHVPEAEEPARVVAMVEGKGCPSLFHESGRWMIGSSNSIDLFMVAKKTTVTRYLVLAKDPYAYDGVSARLFARKGTRHADYVLEETERGRYITTEEVTVEVEL